MLSMTPSGEGHWHSKFTSFATHFTTSSEAEKLHQTDLVLRPPLGPGIFRRMRSSVSWIIYRGRCENAADWRNR